MIKPTDPDFDPDGILTPERRARIKRLVDDRLVPERWGKILTGKKRPKAYDLMDLTGVFDSARMPVYYTLFSRLLTGYDGGEDNGGLNSMYVDDILRAFESKGGQFFGLQGHEPSVLAAR